MDLTRLTESQDFLAGIMLFLHGRDFEDEVGLDVDDHAAA